MNEQEIYCITEAFSMQPNMFYVGMRLGYPESDAISRIELEFRPEWPNGMQRGEYVYAVYGSNNHILMEFLANTVNVQYKVCPSK